MRAAVKKNCVLMHSAPNVIFFIFLLLDFFYWTFNWRLMFQLNEISITYLAYIVLFFYFAKLNIKIFFLYLVFSIPAVLFDGSLNAFKTVSILFIIVQVAVIFRGVDINERYINFLISIVSFKVFLVFSFGSFNFTVFGANGFFVGLTDNYKAVAYSMNLPLFVLGLCIAYTNSNFKKFIIFSLFGLIFYLIFISYARFGLVYIFLWTIYLIYSLNFLLRYLFFILFSITVLLLINEINLDIAYFWFDKGFSGRDIIFKDAIEIILNNPLQFIFGSPGAASNAALDEIFLIPDLGSIFISFFDYGIFGLFVFILLVFKFIFGLFVRFNKVKLPVYLLVFISLLDISSSNFFAFSVPGAFILWSALLNGRRFTN